jgi:hypothetical protein
MRVAFCPSGFAPADAGEKTQQGPLLTTAPAPVVGQDCKGADPEVSDDGPAAPPQESASQAPDSSQGSLRFARGGVMGVEPIAPSS